MSLTVSRGLTDARRWTGVAASVAEFIAASLKESTVPRPPSGALNAARQFFQYVIDGIAIDQKQSPPSEAFPPMAGISNLSIAYEVLTSLPDPDEQPADLEKLQQTVENHLCTLDKILAQVRSSETAITTLDVDTDQMRQLLEFLTELMNQGLNEEEATIANEEHPGGHSRST